MKILRFAAMLLGCVLLAGCGKEEPETEVFYDIETEEEELSFVKERGDSVLGMQFLQGEPVMLVANTLTSYWDIYLCRMDGSRELLVPGMAGSSVRSIALGASDWYVDNEKTVYGISQEVGKIHILVKLDSR